MQQTNVNAQVTSTDLKAIVWKTGTNGPQQYEENLKGKQQKQIMETQKQKL